MDLGADQITPLKDAQTKGMIANLEVSAASHYDIRDTEAARLNPAVSRALRRQMYLGLVLVVSLIVIGYVFFFLFLTETRSATSNIQLEENQLGLGHATCPRLCPFSNHRIAAPFRL